MRKYYKLSRTCIFRKCQAQGYRSIKGIKNPGCEAILEMFFIFLLKKTQILS